MFLCIAQSMLPLQAPAYTGVCAGGRARRQAQTRPHTGARIYPMGRHRNSP